MCNGRACDLVDLLTFAQVTPRSCGDHAQRRCHRRHTGTFYDWASRSDNGFDVVGVAAEAGRPNPTGASLVAAAAWHRGRVVTEAGLVSTLKSLCSKAVGSRCASRG
jgi:hypothetical protein